MYIYIYICIRTKKHTHAYYAHKVFRTAACICLKCLCTNFRVFTNARTHSPAQADPMALVLLIESRMRFKQHFYSSDFCNRPSCETALPWPSETSLNSFENAANAFKCTQSRLKLPEMCERLKKARLQFRQGCRRLWRHFCSARSASLQHRCDFTEWLCSLGQRDAAFS